MKNKKVYLTLVIIIAVIAGVVAISFAFMGSRATLNGAVNVNGTIGSLSDGFSFTHIGNMELTLNLDMEALSSAESSNDYTKYIEAQSNITINLTSDSNLYPEGITCKYSIYYDPTTSYTPSQEAQNSNLTELGVVGNTSENQKFNLVSIDNLNTKTKIHSDRISTSASSSSAYSNWLISLRFHNLDVDQITALGQNPSGKISFEVDECYASIPTEEWNFAQYISKEVYTSDGENGLYYHDGKGSYTNVNLEIGDNSYRYAGADPKNYVCFFEDANEDGTCTEDNLYRIIGVIDGKVKLIKYTDINTNGTLVWNSSGVNTWEGGTLETHLNSEEEGGYLNKLGTTKANLIDNTTWSVGGFTWSQAQSENAKGIYTLEMASKPKTTKGQKVGLMYVHEYMYAALPTYWAKVGYNSSGTSYDYRSSLGNNWIWSSGIPLTISRASDGNWGVFRLAAAGNPGTSNVSSTGYAVRPSFSLNSNATITIPTGEDAGSSSKPYIITGVSGSTPAEPTFPMYWNNNFEYATYTHPNTPSTTYESVAELQAGYSNFANRPYYIKTTDTEHQVCLYYNNKEFCLSKGYWEGELGVANEAAGNSTKGKLQTEMATSFEIEESSLSCYSNASNARCSVGAFYCYASSDGSVDCVGGGSSCGVNSGGSASCYW